ncbi:MAG: leucyl aminopeptidase [Nitrospiraceae bacterium]
MKTVQVEAKQGRVEGQAADLVVVLLFDGDGALKGDAAWFDKALHGAIGEARTRGEFDGRLGECLLMHTQEKVPAKRVLLVGLGARDAYRMDTLRQAMGQAAKRMRQAKAVSCYVAPPPVLPRGCSAVEAAQAMTEGAMLGCYHFNDYRSDRDGKPESAWPQLTILVGDKTALKAVAEGVRRGAGTAEAAWLTRDLCNHPSNVMTPARIADEAKAIAKETGASLTILEKKDLEALGAGALLGVGMGSHKPPKMIVLEYKGPQAKKAAKGSKPTVLVGKTVTFDTGGISLKPSENMEHMKADMTGGAEVLAAVRAAARLKLPIHLIGVLPVAENMPGGGAMRPGDVVTTLSGKTVEVQNTDAEGRLILADALAYVKRFEPAAVIDVATLTGACVVALGQFAIGLFGTDDKLKQRVAAAGQKAGERTWEMPLWDDYFEQLRSDVADMRNIGGRGGGMITAALFLSKFAEGYPWVHLDIASTDWSERERAYVPKGPSGIGARLLVQYLIDQSL